MVFKSLKGKMLSIFLPLVIIGLGLFMAFSYNFSKAQIDEEINSRMTTLQDNAIHKIEGKFASHQQVAESTASVVNATGQSLSRENYQDILEKSIMTNEDTLGAGVWYEKYAYDSSVEYFGPYVYKDGGSAVFTDEYETAEYDYPSWNWYTQAQGVEDAVWGDPYYDEASDITMVTTSVPFEDESGNFGGVITADIDLTQIQEIISDIQIYETGWAFSIDNSGTFIAHDQDEKVMNETVEEDAQFNAHSEELLNNSNGHFAMKMNGKDYQVYYNTISRTGWKVGLMVPEGELYASLDQLLIQQLTLGGIVIILLISAIYLFGNRITKPVTKLKEETDKVAQGDLTVTVAHHSNDEVGLLYSHFNVMLNNMRDLIYRTTKSAAVISNSAENFRSVSEGTTASNEEIQSTMEEITKGAHQSSEDLDQMRTQIDMLSGKIESVAQSSDHMNGLSDRATTVNQNGLAQMDELRKHSEESKRTIAEVENVVRELTNQIEHIGNFILTINNISEQTNLLALNASIEAARAGEHGAGFAVVAEEVRKLAEQTANSTDEVRKIIDQIQISSTGAINKMDDARKITNTQNDVVAKTEEAFNDIESAVRQITNSIESNVANVEDINQYKNNVVSSVDNIASSIQQTAAANEEINSSIDEQTGALESLAHSAENLNQSSHQLHELVKEFEVGTQTEDENSQSNKAE
ncbi:methyl-accepting chemotaxis protein [Halobacillus seohaensis]|uniref:Methyl-accepting chemotaxis protein n=1 Tax=Halobacillus seohaensis TaxID=447421 RepID=A0ABW2EQQ7_9BACI